MKFSLKDFLELDTKSLFAVNGGSDCGTSSGSFGGGSGSSSNSLSGNGGYTSNSATNSGQTTQWHETHDYKGNLIRTPVKVDGGTKSRGNTITSSSATVAISGGGSCSGCSASGTSSAPSYTKPSGISGSSSSPSSGGTCSGSGGTDTNGGTKQPESKYKHQVCSNPSDVHCDIIAWNHAVDAGLNPTGSDKEIWDGNKLSVDQIFDEHYANSAIEFNSECAGLEGYLFYDWDGADINGEYHYEHMEFCKVSSDGSGYSYFSNEGMESGEVFKYNVKFSEDPNAHARNPENGGNGHVMFVPLNN